MCVHFTCINSHISAWQRGKHSFCTIIVITTMFLTEWDPQLSNFCLLLFTLVSCCHVIMCEGTTARQRQHLCKKRKKIWTTPEGAPPYLRNSGAFQASDALYSGIISGFIWTEEPRCIWPLSVQNSIKAKPDLLHVSLHPQTHTISLNFTSIHSALLAWMLYEVYCHSICHLPINFFDRLNHVYYMCTIYILMNSIVRALWCISIFIFISSLVRWHDVWQVIMM